MILHGCNQEPTAGPDLSCVPNTGEGGGGTQGAPGSQGTLSEQLAGSLGTQGGHGIQLSFVGAGPGSKDWGFASPPSTPAGGGIGAQHQGFGV